VSRLVGSEMCIRDSIIIIGLSFRFIGGSITSEFYKKIAKKIAVNLKKN
jgi:hypothetical protein